MRIRVRFFAILKDRAGVPEAEFDLSPGSTVGTAIEAIQSRYPATARDLVRSAFAVNRSYSRSETILNDGDELALIPPVSGG